MREDLKLTDLKNRTRQAIFNKMGEKAHQADHIMGKSDIVSRRSIWFLWTFPNSMWMLVSSQWTSNKRDNPCGRNTPHILQRIPMSFHLQGRWWPLFFQMQRALCLLTIFKRAIPSMGADIRGYQDQTPMQHQWKKCVDYKVTV